MSDLQILLPVVGMFLIAYMLALGVSVLMPWMISPRTVNKAFRKMVAFPVRLTGKVIVALADIIEG